jgi:hypothetical protein
MKKKYGEILDFQQSNSFELPDFSITFLGETKVKDELHEHLVIKYRIYFDYEMKSKNRKIIVSWSPGLGFIVPGNFEFGGKKWVLDNQVKTGIVIYPFDQFHEFTVTLPVNKAYLKKI